MDTIFLDGSIIAEYFYIGLALLVLASLVAGYIDAVAGGADSDSRVSHGRAAAANRAGAGKTREHHRHGSGN